MRAEWVKLGRRECPEPERWMAPDDWASECETSEFLGALVRLIKPDFVVETGSYLGFTTERIGWALADIGRGSAVSLELDESRAKRAQEQVNAAGTYPVTVLPQSSLTYTPTQPIDLLFVDSDFPIRMAEVRHFRQWASPRCVIALHDSAALPSYPGADIMLREMEEIVADGTVHPWFYLPTPRGLAMTRYK